MRNPLRWAADRALSAFGYERRALSVDEQLLADLKGAARNLTGVAVTPKSVLSLAAAYAAINVIATDVAALPVQVLRRRPGGGRDEARGLPLWDVLSVSPDGETTAMRQRQAMMGHTLGHGNGYSEIALRRDGQVGALHLIDPSRVVPQRTPFSKALYYEVDGKSCASASCRSNSAGQSYSCASEKFRSTKSRSGRSSFIRRAHSPTPQPTSSTRAPSGNSAKSSRARM